MKLGRNLARTFLDYYKLQNHIVFNPTAALMPKLPNSSSFAAKATTQPYVSNGTSSRNGKRMTSLNSNTSLVANSISSQTQLKPVASPTNQLGQHSNSSLSNASGGSQTGVTQSVDRNNSANSKTTKFYLDNNDQT